MGIQVKNNGAAQTKQCAWKRTQLFMTIVMLLGAIHTSADDSKPSGTASSAKPTTNQVTITQVTLEQPWKGANADFSDETHYSITLDCAWHAPQLTIMGVDTKHSHLDLFMDDKGTDLTQAVSEKGHATITLWPFAVNIAPDAHSCAFELIAHRLPAKGATAIRTKGQLMLRCASGFKTTKSVLKLVIGANCKAGPVTLKLTKMAKPPNRDDSPLAQIIKQPPSASWTNGMVLTFALSPATDVIKKITFLDDKGHEIESDSNFDLELDYSQSQVECKLKRHIQQMTMVVDYYDEIKTVPVSLDLQTGLGW